MHCKCGIEMYPMTGVIIRCKRFWPYEKSAYKISYYYYDFKGFHKNLIACCIDLQIKIEFYTAVSQEKLFH